MVLQAVGRNGWNRCRWQSSGEEEKNERDAVVCDDPSKRRVERKENTGLVSTAAGRCRRAASPEMKQVEKGALQYAGVCTSRVSCFEKTRSRQNPAAAAVRALVYAGTALARVFCIASGIEQRE